jgi:hypothetical protein
MQQHRTCAALDAMDDIIPFLGSLLLNMLRKSPSNMTWRWTLTGVIEISHSQLIA